MSTDAAHPAVTLPTGATMPLLGLGVWQLAEGPETEQAVTWALEAGYRHIDTAALYRNERSVGRALAASPVPREEVFVTTKLRPSERDPEAQLHASLERLGLDDVDLYLIHWPTGAPDKHWAALERLHAQGLAKAIGVSNYGVAELRSLVDSADVLPACNQVEWHPWDFDLDLLELCRSTGVVLEGYSPLGQGRHVDDPRVVELARTLGRTPAQVLIRWSLQRVVTIPRSKSRERIAENFDVFGFELGDEEMARLDGLGR
jgi:diketogulonate reductase-like aldo/keto reductase